jgi:hypothetical protein
MMMTFDEFCDALKNVDVDSQESISWNYISDKKVFWQIFVLR